MKEVKLTGKIPRCPDQQYFKMSYGNEDKIEAIELTNFECPNKLAEFLRTVANNIEGYKNSKEYRSSGKSIFEGTEHNNEF